MYSPTKKRDIKANEKDQQKKDKQMPAPATKKVE